MTKLRFLWDFNMKTDGIFETTKPDIRDIEKKKARKCLLIDVAVPGGYNIKVKENEKLKKYTDLYIEVARVWVIQTTIVPVFIGMLGSIPQNIKTYIKQIRIKQSMPPHQCGSLW